MPQVTAVSLRVIPTKAGIQEGRAPSDIQEWIPACAGMTCHRLNPLFPNTMDPRLRWGDDGCGVATRELLAGGTPALPL